MDKEVKVVIGANYGDEGKGLVAYCLGKKASKQNRKILTVLFNGGAQRGHTAEGKIFHTLGTASIWGSDTYYHPFFVVDPIALWLERSQVFIDPRCRVVVPSDVINNQSAELRRGDERHGSCGMGIFECVQRSNEENMKYRIEAAELKDIFEGSDLYEKLITIEKEYGYPKDILYNNDNWIRAVEWLNDNCVIKTFDDLIREYNYDTIIYEGGQGLLLDQTNLDSFPHLTPSSTGVRNIINDISDLGAPTEVFYVSRTYMTRHGAGPLVDECKPIDIVKKTRKPLCIFDETNQPNPWQGRLRFGYLNQESLVKRVKTDFMSFMGTAVQAKCNLVYTWLDHTDWKLSSKNGLSSIEKPEFVNQVYGSNKKDFMDILM